MTKRKQLVDLRLRAVARFDLTKAPRFPRVLLAPRGTDAEAARSRGATRKPNLKAYALCVGPEDDVSLVAGRGSQANEVRKNELTRDSHSGNVEWLPCERQRAWQATAASAGSLR